MHGRKSTQVGSRLVLASLTLALGLASSVDTASARGRPFRRATMLKTVEDFQKLSKEQFEAATKSATALSQAFQHVASESAAFSKKSSFRRRTRYRLSFLV